MNTKYTSYEEFNLAKCKCNICPIGKAYNKVVSSDGNKTNPKVVFVGEAPGKDEVIACKPFVGKAGKLLRSSIQEAGLTEKDFLITNTIPCRPLDNKFPDDSSLVETCKNMWLKEELLLTNPDLIVLIGAKPLKFILKMEGITKVRGTIITKKLNGKIIKLMPVCHPSYVLRKEYMEEGKQIMSDFKNDIKNVFKMINSITPTL
jgi:uracil-DNA glycosylase